MDSNTFLMSLRRLTPVISALPICLHTETYLKEYRDSDIRKQCAGQDGIRDLQRYSIIRLVTNAQIFPRLVLQDKFTVSFPNDCL